MLCVCVVTTTVTFDSLDWTQLCARQVGVRVPAIMCNESSF